MKVYRQPHKRSVCAQASIRRFVFYTLPGTRKRFSVGLTARHRGGVFGDTFYPSL